MSSLDPTIDLGRGGPRIGSAPLDRLRRVNAACDRFEAAWRRGERPGIEAWVREAEPGDGAELVRELVALEIELRRGAGEDPTVSDYSSRFPGEAIALESLWGCGSHGSVGPYRLHGLLGCGAMGVIYRARQPGANRMVALKLMRAGPHATADEVRRFRAEAEAAANLDHPNILPIHDVGQHEGQPFFTMKLIEGGNLSNHLGSFVGQSEATARLLAKVARAAHHAHRRGFLHRDLKPSNILLDSEGEPHLADFGLAKRVEIREGQQCPEPVAGEETLSGAIVGTPSYMAPEQAAGRVSSLDPATDVYGLGAILYAMLTGRPPFVACTVMETIVQVTEREPVPPRRLRPDVPLDLQRICLKCLEKDATARYATAAALAEDLERFLKKEPVEARHVGVLGRLRRWARREPELVYRVLGIGTSALLTQLNYAFMIDHSERIPALHYRVVGVEGAWIAAIILLHLATRFWPGRLATAWILLDVAALTTLLSLLEGIESALVLAYPLLIAVSGLWSSVGLVWLATFASMGGYLLLWRASAARQEIAKPHYGDVVLATLLVTGAVVAHQVRRVRALSRFYEHKV